MEKKKAKGGSAKKVLLAVLSLVLYMIVYQILWTWLENSLWQTSYIRYSYRIYQALGVLLMIPIGFAWALGMDLRQVRGKIVPDLPWLAVFGVDLLFLVAGPWILPQALQVMGMTVFPANWLLLSSSAATAHGLLLGTCLAKGLFAKEPEEK